MSDQDTTDDEYNRPDDGPATGHAAVGFVTGQRFPDGERPEEVRIIYERDGSEHAAVVLRTSGSVEISPGDSVRFQTARTNVGSTTDVVYIDRLLGARPVPAE